MESSAPHRIAVVTDSTSDLPPHLAEQHSIHVMPQILIMGERSWLDGVDIDASAFYELLRTSSSFPTTSQPSVKAFQDLFTDAAQERDGIVAVLVSDELSGTLNSARAAVDTLPDIPIEIVDSRGASMQLGLIALEAARAAATGKDICAVADAARSLIGRCYVYFVVDTLEYLHRGGRIGAAARIFGSAMNLKPILEIVDGVVTPVTRVRTRRKALQRLHELVAEKLNPGDRVHMSVLHVAAPDEAARIRAELQEIYEPAEMILTECGPVIGAHVGPGTVGVAFFVE